MFWNAPIKREKMSFARHPKVLLFLALAMATRKAEL
jgi:hypothetical protein